MATATLDIRLLGPIAAERDGEPVSLGGPRQRAVLARLALVAGQVVTVDRLVDDVWAGDPPATAVNTLQSYVSLLRRALGDRRPAAPGGAGLRARPSTASELDAARFEDRVTEARAALVDDPAPALAHLEAGARRVARPGARRRRRRGVGARRRPCAGTSCASRPWRPASTRCSRSAATPRRCGELERMVDEHPLREGFARRLMLALYRTGRQAEALRAFTRTRDGARRRARPRPDARAGRSAGRRSSTTIPTSPRPPAPWSPPPAADRRRASRRRGTGDSARRRSRCPARPCALADGDFVGRDRSARRARRRSGRATTGGASHLAPAAGRGGRRQVPARRPVRRERARRGRHRAVGTGDGGGDRAVRADGRGDAHGPADGVRRGPAAGGRRARPARPAAPRPRAARPGAPSSNAPIRASSATCCSRPSPSCCAASRRSTRCSSCSTTSSGPTRRRSR